LSTTLVVDSSVVFSALDTGDPDHAACSGAVSAGAALVLPAPVVLELDWIARSRGTLDATRALVNSLLDGSVLVANLEREDYARAIELVEKYADLPLDLVDASVVAIAERLEQDTIATLDRRHFSVVRPSHIDAFTLVP
jgi:predicted nucleic acid-binding protein